MRGLVTRLTVLLALAALAVTAVFVWSGSKPDDKHITATFASTTSLYKGANVKVLGVAVGKVDSIEVHGTTVRVEISYDDSVKLPADVHALVVPPSIVGDRFIQLAPVWEKGQPTLPDDADLGLDRTEIPLELDDVYRSANTLARALGPNGANKNGALSRLISASAQGLDGNGQLLNQTIRELAGALGTLAAGQADYQGTITNANKITKALAGNDAQIANLVRNLALVSTQLNGQRDDISAASTDLSSALKAVAAFTRKHRGEITESVARLRDVSAVLTRHTAELEELVDLAPVGLVNLLNIYVPRNWDPTKPWLSTPAGRTGSAALRAALLNDLDVQLGFTLGALCTSLPPAQAAQLGAFCTALQGAGGDLGALLMGLIEKGQSSPLPLNPVAGATSLPGLLGGTS
jgi:phospholipid/cholesterol/gamma-HCH transport system substrate-binding protein